MFYADRDTFGFSDPVLGLPRSPRSLPVPHVPNTPDMPNMPQASNLPQVPKPAKARAESNADLLSATSIIGRCVYNHHAEKLGNIKEMMLDVRSGKVKSAVLSFGGLGGFGQKHFVVPWTALMLDKQRQCFVLNVEKYHLSDSPGFQ